MIHVNTMQTAWVIGAGNVGKAGVWRVNCSERLARGSGMGPCSSAKTILIVDDDLNAREAMGKLLHERGYIARGAFNGREALNLLRSGPLPDLILLDLWMEGGD